MSKYKIGDKVYLECEVLNNDMRDNTYQLKYINWYGDKNSTAYVNVDILHPIDDAYNKGLNDTWELAKRIILADSEGGYSFEELKNIFGYRSPASIFKVFTPQEALAKEKSYEKRNEINVGDVVTIKGCTIKGLVTRVSGRVVYRLFSDGSCDCSVVKENLEKTGKHFDSIDEFMKSADD